MSHIDTYCCEMCPELKKENNGWFVGLALKNSTLIMPWDEGTAAMKESKHLCGLDCVGKWVSQTLAKLTASQNAP